MRTRLALIFSLTTLVIAACGSSDVLVRSEQSDRIETTSLDGDPFESTTPVDPDDLAPVDADPDDTVDDTAGDTADDEASTSTTLADPIVSDPDAIDFGSNKPERAYDDFLLATLSDIEAWLTDAYPAAYDEPWRPLEGGVYAGYPERVEPIPGCGEATTDYEDLQFFVAFYCPVGDFIVYDDGDEPIVFPGGVEQEPLLFSLAQRYGPATIGIVLAHEYGHAIQQRSGALDLGLPTVATEQQADCISGAWAGRAAAGDAFGVPFSDGDVRAGLIAMIEVQDPVGTTPNVNGSHGSGFDRVGAFQVGFREGLSRCAELIDAPLPLTPLNFLGTDDAASGGNAPFGFDPPNGLFSFLVPDLNLYFDTDLEVVFPNFEPLELAPTQSIAEVDCDSPVGRYDDGAVLCPDTNTVYLNEPQARILYDEFGDFGPGYVIGTAWAEAAQRSTNSSLVGEARQLRNDCLTGAWVNSVIPVRDANGELVLVEDPETGLFRIQLPQPRAEGRTASISPNDLTEAIQTAIIIGDENASDDVIGSAFEKIDSFRRGTLDGITACT